MSERTYQKEEVKMAIIKDDLLSPRAGDQIPCGTTGTCYTTKVSECNTQLGSGKLSGTLSDKNRYCIKYGASQKYS